MLWLLIITVAVRLPTMFGVKRTGWDERAYVVFAQTLDNYSPTTFLLLRGEGFYDVHPQ
jgi:hypothetical protein